MRVRWRHAVCTLLVLGSIGAAPALAADRIQLRVDTEEAEAVLAILADASAGRAVADSAWQRLFATTPYVRLKQREAEFHRDFTDEDFKRFVLSPELARRADSLRRTLDAWKQADLQASARRVLGYLPDSAIIRASVYPVIKPRTNSFVFQPATDAAIFLYIDPAESAPKFENTVAHEMHHIGLASVSARQEAWLEKLEPRVKTVVEYMGAFGEGLAMLAAAGSPDVHPHATSPLSERAHWDRDMTHFDRDLRRVEKFFLDVVDGRLQGDDKIREVAFSFFGVQGPWYTVGYRMAVTIERRYGRAALVECMEDPRLLLHRYNEAAAEANRSGRERLARWSPALLRRVGAGG